MTTRSVSRDRRPPSTSDELGAKIAQTEILDGDLAALRKSFDGGSAPDLCRLFRFLDSKGLSFSSAAFAPFRLALNERGYWKEMSHYDVLSATGSASECVKRAMDGSLPIDDWQRFADTFANCFEDAKDNASGNVCDGIKSLALADPDVYAASFCTTVGQTLSIGDDEAHFTIQSVSKILTLGLLLETRGEKPVFARIGKIASGRRYNSQFIADGKAPNACVNLGALTAVGMIEGATLADRFGCAADFYAQLAGVHALSTNTATYYVERQSAYDNDAIVSILAKHNLVDDREGVVDLYTQLCAMEMTVGSLSVVGGTLANWGTNPITHKPIMSKNTVKHLLGQMSTAGLYEESGEFFSNHGVYAKSGVSGAILYIIPGIGGGAIFSPRLNCRGNSSRGVEFIGKLVAACGWHQLERLFNVTPTTRRQLDAQKKDELASADATSKRAEELNASESFAN